MQSMPATGPVIKGLDIYYRNNILTFEQLVQQGFQFCFHKATEGDQFVDPKIHVRWPEIKAAGMVRGAYHFFHPGADPVQQAKLFSSVMKPLLEPGDMIFMDWEVSDNVAVDLERQRGLAFLKALEVSLDFQPLIYGSPYFLEALQLDDEFLNYHLWIAEYGVSAPKVPKPWTGWKFWQTGDTGMDYDIFNGTIDQLKTLAAGK